MKENFSEVFVSENNKMGVKSPNGEIIVPASYDEIRYTYSQTISKQPYIAVREGKMGLVSPNGKGTGIAPFVYDNIDILPVSGYFVFRKDGSKRLGIMDTNGNEIIPCVLDSCGGYGQTLYFSRDNLQGLLQAETGVLLEPIYEYIQVVEPEEPIVFTLNGVRGYVKQSDLSFIPETMSQTMDEDEWHDLLLECICEQYDFDL